MGRFEKRERSDGCCDEDCAFCLGQESTEKVIQCSLGGDRRGTDLLLHTDVRWLSRGASIKDFLKLSKHAEYAQLEDYKWLLDLAFLTDLTGLLSELNLELQVRMNM